MPVAADLRCFLSANLVEDDTSTVGGAIDALARPLDAQFSAAARPEIVSDNAADTMNVTIEGRDATGAVISEVLALNGTTPALFVATFERILNIIIASAAAGVVTVKQGTGGTTRHTFVIGETDAAILFQRAAADPSSTETRYDKTFWKNEHGTESLLTAAVELTVDASALFEIGLGAAVNDSLTATNRKTAPAGVTFVDDAVSQNVPGGDLDAGDAIGVWVKQTLAAAQAAGKPTLTTQLSGNSI